MFAYCGNNPVQNTDPSGTTWFTAIVGGIIGAAVGAISAAVTGGTATDVIIGAIAGGASGAVIGATGSLKAGKTAGRVVAASISAVGTFVDAKLNGVNTGDAIICAAASFGVTYGVATISGFAGSDMLASSLSDIMFGLGGGLCSAAITSAATQKANTSRSVGNRHSSNKSQRGYASNNSRPSKNWEVSML